MLQHLGAQIRLLPNDIKLDHTHCVLKHFTVSVYFRVFWTPTEGYYIQIDIRCQPTVQSQFFTAVAKAFLEAGKIQKAEIYRLFDLCRNVCYKIIV